MVAALVVCSSRGKGELVLVARGVPGHALGTTQARPLTLHMFVALVWANGSVIQATVFSVLRADIVNSRRETVEVKVERSEPYGVGV